MADINQLGQERERLARQIQQLQENLEVVDNLVMTERNRMQVDELEDGELFDDNQDGGFPEEEEIEYQESEINQDAPDPEVESKFRDT